jgi:hypothetical protein
MFCGHVPFLRSVIHIVYRFGPCIPTSVVHPVQQLSILDGDASRGYLLHAIGICLVTGVWRVQRERSDGPDQRGHGAVLGCLAGS